MAKKNRLHTIKVTEVSSVDRPMNPGAHVVLWKRGPDDESLAEADILRVRAEVDSYLDNLLTKAKAKAGDDGGNDMSEKLDISKLSAEWQEAWKKVWTRATEAGTAEEKLEALTKRVAAIEADVPEGYERKDGKLSKKATSGEPYEGLPAAAVAELKKRDAKIAADATELLTLKKGAQRERIRKQAEPLIHLAKSGDTFVDDLQKIDDAGVLDVVMPILKAANEAAKLGALTKQLGRTDIGGGDAMEKLDAAAVEIRKGNAKLTPEQAMTQALEENPDLYDEYMAEASQPIN
jgi:polyhydroxyalkanoate synthesis regulator phasin